MAKDTWTIIALAIADMRRAGASDCEIGHSLIRAGITHLEDELAARGLAHETYNQLTAAREFLSERMGRLRIIDTSRRRAGEGSQATKTY